MSGMEDNRFQLPETVVAELAADGYVRSTEEQVGKAVDVGLIALTVYNTVASTVTLLQTPGVIRALAASLRKWFLREKDTKPDYQFEMTALGPLGYIDFKSNEPPTTEALVQFLNKNVWGDAAPPEIEDHSVEPQEIEG